MMGTGALGSAPLGGPPEVAQPDYSGIATLTQVEALAELIQVADDGSCND
jgi:hypothetical protein